MSSESSFTSFLSIQNVRRIELIILARSSVVKSGF
jgi:hypothetical protein